MNNIFPLLRLKLEKKHLGNLNLTEMNFKNVSLRNACLSGLILSKNVRVPDYKEIVVDYMFSGCGDSTLFDAWCFGDSEHQEAYQKIANAQFNMYYEVPHDRLLKGIQKKKTLEIQTL